MKKLRLFTFATLALILTALYAQAQMTVLYNFGNGGPNCTTWSGIIAEGRGGNLVSTAADCWSGAPGAVFKIAPSGMFSALHQFNGTDGQSPSGGATLGTDGNFYGTTESGGTFGNGIIFKITPGGRLTTLYNFTGGADGGLSKSPPIEGNDGNFYGTTHGGGSSYGSVYKITRSGAFTLLHRFDATHGANPDAPLVQGTDDNFYGTTRGGGTHGQGTIFRISPSGKYAVLFNFDGTRGSDPIAPLTQGSDGNFYGTAVEGGSGGGFFAGVVFKVTPSGTLTVLHNFTQGTDGAAPFGGLVQATDGNFYGANSEGPGTANGVLFRITSKGLFTVLHTYDWTADGCQPKSTLLQHTNGKLYGDTTLGGTGDDFGHGTFYSFNIGLAPFVHFLPVSGRVGGTIGFLGQGFTGTSNVSFNGFGAGFTVVNDTYLTVIVPDGATTGFVTVTTPSGTLKSDKKFRVRPQITSFSPAAGPVGTPVIIVGVSLAQTTKVTFGGIKATSVTVNSDMQVTATAPAGALTGKIAVTTLGATTSSPTTFTVKP